MRVKIKYTFAVIALLLFASSCDTNEIFGPHPDKIIVSNPWALERFEYTNEADTLNLGCNLYHFNSDNTFLRSTCEGQTIAEGSWEFLYDYSYLRIGPNTFKVISISKKVMNLRYGDVEMCLLPVK